MIKCTDWKSILEVNMWFKEASIDPVKNAAHFVMICDNCNNEAPHVLVDQPYGLFIGIPFTKRPWLSSHRAYALGCPVCGELTSITKDQAQALIRKGNQSMSGE